MGCTPNPPGMRRAAIPEMGRVLVPGRGKLPFAYNIYDGRQLVGRTERQMESQERYWLAIPADGTPPGWFREGRHQEDAMTFLRGAA